MDKKSFLDLAEKISAGVATDRETELYLLWYDSFQKEEQGWLDEMGDRDEVRNIILSRIRTEIESKGRKRYLYSIRKISAAVLLLIFAAGVYLWIIQEEQDGMTEELVIKNDVLPGGDKAILTLSDGAEVVLDGSLTGVIASEGEVSVKNSEDGVLIYSGENDPGFDEISSDKVINNTITTPQGGQYKVKLHDGTMVWLNALSSIRFPTRFSKEVREVEITGEVYFEVAHRSDQPFKVYSGAQCVEVLGTEFNIQAYEDESSIRTTLVGGAVKVITENESVSIEPGYQVVNFQNDPLEVNQVNAEMAVAWKNGLFQFWDSELEEVMRQLSRWYGIEVDYLTTTEGSSFTGFVSRNVTISNVLRMIEEAGGIQFGLEDKKVFVKTTRD